MKGAGGAGEGTKTRSGGPGTPATERELKAVACDRIHIQEGLVSAAWRTNRTSRGTLKQKQGDELAIHYRNGGQQGR